MENMEKKQCCGDMCACKSGGSCGGMQGMCGGKNYLIKVILKLFIVIIIFWCGFKLGLITGSIRADYGRGMGGEQMYRMMPQ